MRHILLGLAMAACTVALADNSKWMADLPDDAPVCVVSIPGTHDTATGNGLGNIVYNGTTYPLTGASYARTQDLSLSDQLALGIRGLDLRPCTSGSSLHINHGIVKTDLSFQTALETIRDFLIENPTEFVVIHLRHESDGDAGSYDFETLLHQYLDSFDDYISEWRRDLTVGEMRGKMVFLYRDTYDTAPKGGTMTGWVCDNTTWSDQTAGHITGRGAGYTSYGSLYMQDLSNTAYTDGITDKVTAIQTMLDYTTTHYAYNQWRNVWVYNFCSAYSQTTTINVVFTKITTSSADGYRENAGYTNQAVTDYLTADGYVPGPTGIILCDYVGVDTSNSIATNGTAVVQAIIDNNFKYLTAREVDDNEVTELLPSYDASDGYDGWSTTNIGTMSGQHWSDDPSDQYFEMSSSLWSSASKWTATMQQTIEVPNGVYQLTTAGRSSTGAQLTVYANDASYTYTGIGDTGGTIDINGSTGGTLANDGKGRGWAWGTVETTVTDGKLTVKAVMQNTAGTAYQWASVDDFRLFYLGEAEDDSQQQLDELITQAQALTTVNVGDEPFQIPAAAAQALTAAIDAAQSVTDGYADALATLQAAINDFAAQQVNLPLEDAVYNICLVADGFKYDGYPLTAVEGSNASQGNYALNFKQEADESPEQAFTFHAVDGAVNTFTLSFTPQGAEPLYVCTAVSYGSSSKTAMRVIDDATLSLPVTLVAATGQQGVWHLASTLTDTDLGSSATGLFTSGAAYCDLTLTPATVTVPEPEDDTDAIISAAAVVPSGCYDLSGRKAPTPARGVYIQGGRKIVK